MVNIRDLRAEAKELGEEIEKPKRRGLFTSKIMTGIWNLAREYGFRTMKEFWEHIGEIGWDFYDVLHEISP